MKKYSYILLIFLFSFSGKSQSNTKKFSKLTGPEKCWVIFHIFKAKKAYKISLEAQRVSDSIQKTNLLDKDKNGGQVDAFRHAFWMATLAKKIGKRSAKSLGKAHEKGNYKQFKKGLYEDGTLPDEPSSEMDLFNNELGIEMYLSNKKATKKELIQLILKEIKTGKLKIIKKDKEGNYLNCNGKVIPKKEYHGRWKNSKCLVSSKERF